MFWGITLDAGKRYTQTVEKSFHLSMAALGFQNCSSTPVTVMVEVDKAQFAICTLQPGKIPQQPLDYCFTEGEEITLYTEGAGDVHLTGYLIEEPNALEFEDEEISDASEESDSVSESSCSESDESGSPSREMNFGDLLHDDGKMNVGNGHSENATSDDEDDDWDPTKENPKRQKKSKKDKKPKHLKEKSEESNDDKEQLVMDLFRDSDVSDDDLFDEDYGHSSLEEENKSRIKQVNKLETNKKWKKCKLKVGETEGKEATESDNVGKIKLPSKKQNRKPKHLKEKSEESSDDKEQLVMDLFRDSDVSDDDLFDEDYDRWSLEEENKSRIKQVNKLETNKKGKKRKLKVDEMEGKEATENDNVGKITLPSKKQKRKNKTPPKATDGPSIEQAAQSDKGAVNSSLNVITNSSEKLNSPSRKDSSKDVKETPTVEVKSPQEIQQKSHQKQSNKKKLPGGTVVEDITKGQGKIAKKGHKVSVYYKGTLSKNKKQFDACLSGKPFNFRLGVGEVIRGWDLGVEGMQVGGKRKLIVPPSQGYGSEKTGPIPPDSTLEFEIQLMRLK